MPELERLIADARPDWPDPLDGAEDRILGGLGLREPCGPGAWLRRAPRSRRLRLLAAAALLTGSGAAIAVALTGGGPAPAGAHASLDFGPPQAIGPASPHLGGASLAVDATGTVTAAWSYAGRVFAASRARGGTWSAAERLSDPSVRALRPQVAAGPAGRAVIVWRERSPGRVVRRAFTLPGGAPAGTLEAVATVSPLTFPPVGGPGVYVIFLFPPVDVRLVPGATPTLLWSEPAGATRAAGRRLVAARRDADGAWRAERLGGAPGLAPLAGGDWAALWFGAPPNGAATRIQMATSGG